MSLPVNKPLSSFHHWRTLLWTSSHFYYKFFLLYGIILIGTQIVTSPITHTRHLWPISPLATRLHLFLIIKKKKELSLIPCIVSCHLHVMTILLLPFQHIYVLFLFLAWLLWLGLPKLYWIEVVRLQILVFSRFYWEGFQLFTVECYVGCGFAINRFHYVELWSIILLTPFRYCHTSSQKPTMAFHIKSKFLLWQPKLHKLSFLSPDITSYLLYMCECECVCVCVCLCVCT